MKKMVRYFCTIILCSIFALAVTACEHQSDELTPPKSTIVSSSDLSVTETTSDYSQTMPNDFVNYDDLVNPKVFYESEHYRIIESDNSMYYCYIYGSDNNIVFEQGFKSPHYPQIEAISDDIIELSVGYGTGLTCRRYYSISRDCFSVDYWYASDPQPDVELIAYTYINESDPLDSRCIVVRNIFDKSVYYKKFSEFENPLADTPQPILYAKFSDDAKTITITYLTGEDYREVSQDFSL